VSPAVLNNNTQWWIYQQGSGRTYSWSVAASLWSFLWYSDTHNNYQYRQNPPVTAAYTPASQGDPIFYDWENDGHIDHVAIMVGTGSAGDQVDEHTSNRKRVVWTLQPYNSKWRTTSITEIHING